MIYDKVENMSLYFNGLKGFEKVEEVYKEFLKAPFAEGAFSFVVIAKFFHLLLQETGFKDDAAAVDLAIYLLVVVGKANALHLGATLDDH